MAILHIAGGVLGPVGGSITLICGSHAPDVGVIDVSVQHRETKSVPV